MAKIYISPSTQEHNNYANGGTEEQWMNKLADILCPLLTQVGIIVYRNKPEMSLGQVVDDSNAKKVDFHFALHSNAGGGRGGEVFCHRFGGNGEKFARILYSKLSSLTPTADRGVHEGFNFYGVGKHMYELYNTDAPAALVEVDFHDTTAGALWIEGHLKDIAYIYRDAICEYFGITITPAKSETRLLAEAVAKIKAGDATVISDVDYWTKVLDGKEVPKPEYLKTLFSRITKLQ